MADPDSMCCSFVTKVKRKPMGPQALAVGLECTEGERRKRDHHMGVMHHISDHKEHDPRESRWYMGRIWKGNRPKIRFGQKENRLRVPRDCVPREVVRLAICDARMEAVRSRGLSNSKSSRS